MISRPIAFRPVAAIWTPIFHANQLRVGTHLHFYHLRLRGMDVDPLEFVIANMLEEYRQVRSVSNGHACTLMLRGPKGLDRSVNAEYVSRSTIWEALL